MNTSRQNSKAQNLAKVQRNATRGGTEPGGCVRKPSAGRKPSREERLDLLRGCGDAITATGSVLDVEGPLRAHLPRPVALCPDCGIDFVDWLRGGRSAIPARLTPFRGPGPRPTPPAVKRSTRGPTDPTPAPLAIA